MTILPGMVHKFNDYFSSQLNFEKIEALRDKNIVPQLPKRGN